MSRRIAQVGAWALFAALVGVFAQWPRFSPLPAGHAELRLSLAHLTERMEPCRQLSDAELQALPPNMRMREQCGRARAPAQLELHLDEVELMAAAVRPAGLHREGRAYLYRTWSLPAGDYTLRLRLHDSPDPTAAAKQQQFRLQLSPGMAVVLEVGDGDARLLTPDAAVLAPLPSADHAAASVAPALDPS